MALIFQTIIVQQGMILYDILKQLSGLPPSETRRAIVSVMQKAGLKISVYPLYAGEIKELQEKCKEMLLREAEATL